MANENGGQGAWSARDSVVVTLLSSFLNLIVQGISNIFSNKRQQEHDVEMANINLENEKKLMSYQNMLQQDTNMIATQKGHAAAAGYSPALLYGESMPTASVSGGTASGSASKMEPLNLFSRLPMDSVGSTLFDWHQQQLNERRIDAEVKRQEAAALYDSMKTAHEYYDTRVAKRAQNVILDKMYFDLENAKQDAKIKAFNLSRSKQLLPGELVQQGLVNKELEQRVIQVQSDIVKNTWEARNLAANISRINKLNEMSDEEIRSVRESTRGATLGRVMSEFGLNGRLEPSVTRSWNSLSQSAYYDQMKAATAVLVASGFDADEAAKAVLYYNARDPKDVSPSVINGLARIVTAAMK